MLMSTISVEASYKKVFPVPMKFNLFTGPSVILVPAELIPRLNPPVAVTIPTALIPPARTLTPVRAVIIPSASILVTSSYVRVPPTETLPPTLKLVPSKVKFAEPEVTLDEFLNTT